MTKIGVLALQGDFREHMKMLDGLGLEASEIRLPGQLDCIDGLIIPGGESTTIVQLMDNFGLTDRLKFLIKSGLPTWGTCAGMIVLAKDITDDRPIPLGIMDISVRRNAYGRQIDSFETSVLMPAIGDVPFNAIFIRAPLIERVGPNVSILATLDNGEVIAAQEGNVIVTSFHPELTEDKRLHQYFLDNVRARSHA